MDCGNPLHLQINGGMKCLMSPLMDDGMMGKSSMNDGKLNGGFYDGT